MASYAYNIYWSAPYASRNISSDPWNARTLEWATASPVQFYNFAKVPEVKSIDAFWYMKKHNEGLEINEAELKDIHMPNNSGLPFMMAVVFGIAGFFLIFEWKMAALVAALGIIVCLIVRSFDTKDGFHVPVDDIRKIERAWRNLDKEVKKNHVS